MNLHEELKEKALPIITAFHNDLLVHDKTEIERYPNRRFLHFTGDTGTCMVTLFNYEDYPEPNEIVPYLFGTADRYHIAKGITETVEVMNRCNRLDLILYFNGTRLKEIDYDNAKSIAIDYRHQIENRFRKNN